MYEITARIGLTRTHVSKRSTSLSKKTLSGSMTLRHSKKMTLLSTSFSMTTTETGCLIVKAHDTEGVLCYYKWG